MIGAARLALAGWAVAASSAAILDYWAPSSRHMIGFEPWLFTAVLERSALAYWGACALASWALWRRARVPSRRLALLFPLAQIPLGLIPALAGWPPGAGDSAALAGAVLAWEPLLAFEAALAALLPAGRARPRRSPELDLAAAAAAAALVWLASAAWTWPYGFHGRAHETWALAASLALHLALFMSAACFWTAADELAFPLLAVVLAVVGRGLLGLLALDAAAAWLIAAAWAAALAAAARGALRGWAPAAAGSALRLSAPLVLALAWAGLCARLASAPDWQHLFQTLVVLAGWGLAALACRWSLAPAVPRRALWGALAFVAAAAAAAGARQALAAAPAVSAALRRHAESEPSLRTALWLLRREAGEGRVYDELWSRYRAGQSRPAVRGQAPLAAALAKTPGVKPHLFVLVIDSLRQDYVGAYDRRAAFTPALDALARDGTAFPSAFTPYGGTALAEPAIWTGALLPQNPLPAPFGALDALGTLVEREGYRRLIAFDVILERILSPSAEIERLRPAETGSHRLCPALESLAAKLPPSGGADARPLFSYIQAHDLHLSLLNADEAAGLTSPRGVGRPGGGFDARYASKLSEIDACLGRFVAALKAKGLYDRSVVVVTSDHGDSLGEGGRWGHAYTLYPEIVRIPLVVRAPRRLTAGLVPDLARPASLIDIAPTLYALLGHGPLSREPRFGRPLWAPAGAARDERDLLLASSYGPVYGLLKERGRYLYIVDALERRSHYYDLASDPSGRLDLWSPEVEAANLGELTRRLELLDSAYR